MRPPASQHVEKSVPVIVNVDIDIKNIDVDKKVDESDVPEVIVEKPAVLEITVHEQKELNKMQEAFQKMPKN